jgi:hypothetical protein
MASPYQAQAPRAQGSVALSTSQTSNTTTLGFTPDWVVFSVAGAAATAGEQPGMVVTISGTTTGLLTFSRAASTSAATVYFLAGETS